MPFFETGVVKDNVVIIECGGRGYQDHPKTTPLFDFIQELYDAGYKEVIQEGRKELGSLLEDGKHPSLKSLRLKQGLSQGEMAKLAGVQQYQISRYESGRDRPNGETMKNLCAVLKVDPNTLFEALGLWSAKGR
jgi:DNA-binding XRE family transcriptional regulator